MAPKSLSINFNASSVCFSQEWIWSGEMWGMWGIKECKCKGSRLNDLSIHT